MSEQSPMAMLDERRARELLRRSGVRRTAQRVAVLLLLASAYGAEEEPRPQQTHLSSRQIHDQLVAGGADIDPATVYRTVTAFEHAGLLHATATNRAITYGLAVTPHHHAVCTHCGEVTEISPDELGDRLAPLLEVTGYSSADAEVTVHGLCPSCRQILDA